MNLSSFVSFGSYIWSEHGFPNAGSNSSLSQAAKSLSLVELEWWRGVEVFFKMLTSLEVDLILLSFHLLISSQGCHDLWVYSKKLHVLCTPMWYLILNAILHRSCLWGAVRNSRVDTRHLAFLIHLLEIPTLNFSSS